MFFFKVKKFFPPKVSIARHDFLGIIIFDAHLYILLLRLLRNPEGTYKKSEPVCYSTLHFPRIWLLSPDPRTR